MKLGEISLDSSITVTVIKGDTHIDLQTTPVMVMEDVMYVEPFMYNGSMLSFTAEGLFLDMTVTKGSDVPFFWKNVRITKESMNGVPCHAIRTSANGVRLNRRNAFRVHVGIDGIVSELGKGAQNVLVRDISANGFSFVVNEGAGFDYKPGEQIHINYVDAEYRFTVNAEGRLVRREEVVGGVVYGCKFARLYPQIDNYVAKKQLKNRAKGMMALVR